MSNIFSFLIAVSLRAAQGRLLARHALRHIHQSRTREVWHAPECGTPHTPNGLSSHYIGGHGVLEKHELECTLTAIIHDFHSPVRVHSP